ncbi:arginine deiminase [Enterococcus sp. 7E2_DIV0204]|uniref:arginine deiminase n=1 Tax=unclassified Enterococcus TaxID=2608891 RepID=UPI000A34BFC5|nr:MULTISPECIES: arginine deiminase [unclassified Enterococcus]OTN90136.1 arginine deiminase [Enterococcus sp. 7E2_DIV0204]OTP52591.1 arginine deiminase [Enterococcus sp. 7D2_DIV0200]
MKNPINVFSEIGKLNTVMLHRPGKELENLMPDYLESLLFDDIPFLEQAQKEHDFFAETLRLKGVEILYLEDLAAESLTEQTIKDQFITEYLNEADIKEERTKQFLQEFLQSIPDGRELIDKTMAGIQKSELATLKQNSLSDLADTHYPFIIDPMPNLYFTRDPFATIGHGVSLNRMYSVTRRRETLYGKYIFGHHPMFKTAQVPMVYSRDENTRIEGGDELILSKKLIAVGISQRTDVVSIEKLARNIFEQELGFERVLAFEIGEERKFMHLDTVFTMVDHDKFTIHPEIEGNLTIYSISQGKDGLVISEETDTLEHILCKYLELDHVTLIRCGGGNPTAAAREQWNDGSNTLAIAPGEVVVYDRNTVTNQKLEEAGVKLNYIPGSELVRGRGGPRCMSMPFDRTDI